jgi:hypothetical protein
MARTTPPADDTLESSAPVDESAENTAQLGVQPCPLNLVDEYQGQGGTYLLDPETGIRTLVERTLPASL